MGGGISALNTATFTILCPLSFVLWLLSFVFCPLSSGSREPCSETLRTSTCPVTFNYEQSPGDLTPLNEEFAVVETEHRNIDLVSAAGPFPPGLETPPRTDVQQSVELDATFYNRSQALVDKKSRLYE